MRKGAEQDSSNRINKSPFYWLYSKTRRDYGTKPTRTERHRRELEGGGGVDVLWMVRAFGEEGCCVSTRSLVVALCKSDEDEEHSLRCTVVLTCQPLKTYLY